MAPKTPKTPKTPVKTGRTPITVNRNRLASGDAKMAAAQKLYADKAMGWPARKKVSEATEAYGPAILDQKYKASIREVGRKKVR
jgi:hypothetical protein